MAMPMNFDIADGFPAMDTYQALVASSAFKKMSACSDAFLQRNHASMGYYRLRWGKDPLRNWSRQWEYPFVFQSVMYYSAGHAAPLKILDAGSGVTFLPWLLQEALPAANVSCCDQDERLAGIYTQINAGTGQAVEFTRADMAALPYPDASFDVVYCISVLEHTRNYPDIIQEFRRVLRPGGRLIITFDVSLDGMHQISVPDGERLLDVLGAALTCRREHRLAAELAAGSVLTTHAAGKIDPALLPWKFPLYSRCRASLQKGRWVAWPPMLTVYCLAADKN
jgi:SAM-dependent methyltransferase